MAALPNIGGALCSTPQIFGPCLLWPNDWMDQNATWPGGRSRPRSPSVTWGPSPYKKNRAQPPISALVCCGHTAGWIKMHGVLMG